MSEHMPRQPEPEYMDLPEEASAYADADFSDVNQAFVEHLLELAPPLRKPLALDLGTGPGDIPLRLLRMRPEWRVAGLDAARAMLAFARGGAKAEGRLSSLLPVNADSKRCPFPDTTFDVIFSNSILHHITDVAPFWSELKRVARPGAFIFLRDLARPANPESARAIVERYSGNESELLKGEYYRSLLSAYTPEEVRTQLRGAGLDSLEVKMVTDRHLDVFGCASH